MTTDPASSPNVGRIQSWLDREYHVSDEHLGFVRVLYCTFVLFVIGVPSFTWIANSQQLFFDPPLLSAANLLSSWPAVSTLWILSVALVILFLLLLFGFFVPTVSVLISLLMIAGSNLRFSFGKIDHTILFVVVPLVMAGSGWGNRFTLVREPGKPNRSGICLAIFALVLGFAMFTAGYQKVTTGWLDIRTHAAFGHLIQDYFTDGRTALLAPVAIRVRSDVFWESLDYFTVGFELLFILAASRRWLFRSWIGVAVLFHTGVLLMLNIGFSINFAAYLLFFEWPLPRRTLASRRTTWLVAAGTSVLVLWVWWASVAPNQPLFLQWAPSVTTYMASRLVGQANMNDTTLEIVPACLAVSASIILLVRHLRVRPRLRHLGGPRHVVIEPNPSGADTP